tara:strand:- start:3944 stop:4360 length:417 start_codon:yes stop_codon:yes gene_type:complete
MQRRVRDKIGVNYAIFTFISINDRALSPFHCLAHGEWITCEEDLFNYVNQHGIESSQLRQTTMRNKIISKTGEIYHCSDTRFRPKPNKLCFEDDCPLLCGMRPAELWTANSMLQEGDVRLSHLYLSKACKVLFGQANQ